MPAISAPPTFMKNLLTIAIFLSSFCIRQSSFAAETKPNIILILADDMGYADPTCFGGKAVATPHLDALARSGTKMTRFYAASAVCSPTRASILTVVILCASTSASISPMTSRICRAESSRCQRCCTPLAMPRRMWANGISADCISGMRGVARIPSRGRMSTGSITTFAKMRNHRCA